MEWIKKNYDRFALIVLSTGLVVSAGLTYWNGQQFQNSFGAALANPEHHSKVDSLDDSALTQAQASLAKPASWSEAHRGSLFVSLPYIVKDGDLVYPPESPIDLHPPVKNQWLIENHLDILDPDVLNQDADGDGFTNVEEFLSHTDPQGKDSRPPYVAKLRMERWVREQFQFTFMAYDESAYQINTVSKTGVTQFYKIGDQIAGTNFKLFKFEPKKVTDNRTGGEKDVSELTLKNTESNELLVLPLNTVINSPDSYAVFKYGYDNSTLKIRKNQQFVLKPESGVEYKLIDISENEAVLKDAKNLGTEIKVLRLEDSAH
jgi:hypothetical protein